MTIFGFIAAMKATTSIHTPTPRDADTGDKPHFDWWSKYYCSIGDDKRTQKDYVDQGYDRMVVYPCELEDVFYQFMDLAQTFALHRDKSSKDPKEKSAEPVGYFKGSLKIYPLPDDGSPLPDLIFSNLPSTDPVEVIVRVYIIRVREHATYIPLRVLFSLHHHAA